MAGGADLANQWVAPRLSDRAGVARRRGPVDSRDRGSVGPQRQRREGSRAPRAAVSPQTARRGHDDVGRNGSHSVRIMNQLAGADVKSLEGTLEACGATAGLVDGRSSELPACRLRRVTQHVQENLQRELRLAELSALDGLCHTTESRLEEHTAELQSPCNIVCRLLLEKKKNEEKHEGRAGTPVPRL